MIKLDITHILNVAADCPPSRIPGIAYKHLKIWDEVNEDLEQYWELAFDFIRNPPTIASESAPTLPEKDRILVHCVIGRSRSAAFVIAYLMVHLKMPLLEALQKVKKVRNVCPSINTLQKCLYFEMTKIICGIHEAIDEIGKESFWSTVSFLVPT